MSNVSNAFVILFAILFLSVFFWFFLLIRLFDLLKSHHLEKYVEMGEPTLFWNSSPKTVWNTMKFLFRREYMRMDDPRLVTLGNTMLVFLIVFMPLCFLLMFATPFVDAP